jgi:hypothetical protein
MYLIEETTFITTGELGPEAPLLCIGAALESAECLHPKHHMLTPFPTQKNTVIQPPKPCKPMNLRQRYNGSVEQCKGSVI